MQTIRMLRTGFCVAVIKREGYSILYGMTHRDHVAYPVKASNIHKDLVIGSVKSTCMRPLEIHSREHQLEKTINIS